MRIRILVTLFGILVIGACSEKPKQEVFEVHPLNSPSAHNSSLPFLFSNSNKALLSWVEKVGDSTTRLRYSEIKDGKWQAAKDITAGTDWFVNWADFPAIAENNGHLFSHVLQKSSKGTYSYDVKMNLLPSGSEKWNTAIPLHTDKTATEHGFVTVLPYQKDSFFVTWLDGRNTEDGTIKNETLLDSRTCDCCQTTAAITANGPVVVYRDRTEDEIRDISIVRRINGEWTSPTPVHEDNWKIKGCPVNGPKAAAIENITAVAWFTAADEKPTVKVSFSGDGGANFDKPIIVNTSNVIGRVDVLLLSKQEALISYMETVAGHAQLKVAKVNRSGQMDKRTITELEASRQTGFPQMELIGDEIHFAWTAVDKETSSVKAAYVSRKAF